MIIRGRYDSESDLVYCYEKDETGSNVKYKRETDTVYNMARRTETEQRQRQINSRRKSKEEKVYQMVNGCWIFKDGSLKAMMEDERLNKVEVVRRSPRTRAVVGGRSKP